MFSLRGVRSEATAASDAGRGGSTAPHPFARDVVKYLQSFQGTRIPPEQVPLKVDLQVRHAIDAHAHRLATSTPGAPTAVSYDVAPFAPPGAATRELYLVAFERDRGTRPWFDAGPDARALRQVTSAEGRAPTEVTFALFDERGHVMLSGVRTPKGEFRVTG